MGTQFTPGPWSVCQHLKSVECDAACGCGYRGVIYGPEHDLCLAICQPGHEPAPEGQEGTEPARYPREVEIANAHLIAAAPDLYEALAGLADAYKALDLDPTYYGPGSWYSHARAALSRSTDGGKG